MSGTVRLSAPAYALIDGAVRVLAVAMLAHVGMVVMRTEYDGVHPFQAAGPIPIVLVHIVMVAFAFALLLLRRRVRGGTRTARFFASLLAMVCVVDALVWFRRLGAGELTTRVPVPLTLLVAVLLYFWVIARKTRRSRASAGRSERVLWNKMLDSASP